MERELSDHNPRKISHSPIARDTTEGLGYCCEWFFWKKFGSVKQELLAARFGVDVRSIRRRIDLMKNEEIACTCSGHCMKKLLKEE